MTESAKRLCVSPLCHLQWTAMRKRSNAGARPGAAYEFPDSPGH